MFLIVCGVVMSSLGDENSGEVVEKSGLGDVGEESLPYDPNASFSVHSSASGNGKRSNSLMQRVTNDGEDVEKLQEEIEEIRREMEWLERRFGEVSSRGELLSVVKSGRRFDFMVEVELEVKERQMDLFRSRKTKLRVLRRVVKRIKRRNEAFEVKIPEEWEEEDWELEEEVFEKLRKDLERKRGGGGGVKRERKSGEEGGERREVVVKKRVKLENVPSLKEGDRWLKTISVKKWATFEREFKKKMKFAD